RAAIPLASFYNEKHFNHYLQKKHFDHIEENHMSERKTITVENKLEFRIQLETSENMKICEYIIFSIKK
ncbi:hypothetical protein ACJX0J_015565, partial [Zea mays]